MFANKPIIGLAGGIGAGKSFVASLFAEMGCLVLSADAAVTEAYSEPEVCEQLKQWWGENAFDASGQVNRRWIAERVFNNTAERQRLEALIHPRVAAIRQQKMEQKANDPATLAFIWDVPLLFETGQDRQCDAIVFVEASLDQRLARVKASRGWDQQELFRRENLQMPLDKKREMSDYIVVNAADAAETRRQVRDVLSRIFQLPQSK
ncbi:MAG TPA: dephospho-CoA kinase [Tepidisphaeraceae bacterium]|nr:dephospho-CoA kinase [Tepidisphaeraceae bacterium]